MFVKLVLVFCVLLNSICFGANHRGDIITYGQSYGRFGDNLLSYMHAKWVSHKYKIPLSYKPFIYSDGLVLHWKEKSYSTDVGRRLVIKREMKKGDSLHSYMRDRACPTLYSIPYFPDSAWEHANYATRFDWPKFAVDWENEEFKIILKEMIAPKVNLQLVSIPEGKTSVCVHIRRGGGNDDVGEGVVSSFPLKFPSNGYYLTQLRRVYATLGNRPLYVHIFSDIPDMIRLKSLFEKEFENDDIVFACREKGNNHNKCVLEDFFSMTKFDCIILPESNFSYCASLISDYLIKVMPKDFHIENGKVIIDTVYFKAKGG